MQRRSTSRYLFFFVLLAIAVVYLVGRFWLDGRTRPAATEAGLVPTVVPGGN